MSEKIAIKMNGITIGTADTEGMKLIIAEPYADDAVPRNLNINISEGSKSHPELSYTTDIGTLELIFRYQTFRSSSLSNANLNDPMEKERVGVSEYADGRFITCFCQSDHENVPFWMYYGKDKREEKVLLRFKNFAPSFADNIFIDYALTPDGRKCAFKSPDNLQLINRQHFDDRISQEYDLRGIISAILMFDVEYVPATSEIFTTDYAGSVDVDFSRVGDDGMVIKMDGVDPTVLGKQKSNPWEYEKETRIMSVLSGGQFPGWDFIDLRLKPTIFKDLSIVLSPWDDGSLKSKVCEAIRSSSLPDEIKDSIEVIDSALKGKLNFPVG
ncbi:MAG: hypothetical protein HUJ72_09965 [Blautia sp.]|nr:hypothetical protein [Blautia sp.]